jgi:hypothetical protein
VGPCRPGPAGAADRLPGDARRGLVAAAHLWADAATVEQLPPLDLDDLVARLDDGNWRRLLGALAIRRAGLRGAAWPLDLAGLLEEA